jgi:hypothetical protein
MLRRFWNWIGLCVFLVRSAQALCGTLIAQSGCGSLITAVVSVAGIPGSSGAGGLAMAARLNSPYGVAADTAGKLFGADSSTYRVKKY